MVIKWKGIKVIVFVFIFAICYFAYTKLPVQFMNGTSINGDTAKEDLGVAIESVSVLKGNLDERISYIGTLYPSDTMQATVRIPAEILEINIDEGEYVRKGQVIAKLEDANIIAAMNTLQAKIETVEFQLGYLRDEEEKYRALYENSAIAKAVYDKVRHETGMVEMQLNELYVQKDEISVKLKDTVITAPMSGVVREVNYDSGDLAAAGKPAAIIDDVSELIIKISVSESDLRDIRIGTPARLEIAKGEVIDAKVTKILPEMNPKTRIGDVEIKIKRWDKMYPIIIGTSIKAEFIKKTAVDTFIIPQSALKQLASGYVLYRIDGENVYEVPVEIGIQANNQVQIISGVVEGDKIAVGNIDKLYDGAKVYVFERED